MQNMTPAIVARKNHHPGNIFKGKMEVQENHHHQDHSETPPGCTGDDSDARAPFPVTSEIHHFLDHGVPEIIISATFSTEN